MYCKVPVSSLLAFEYRHHITNLNPNIKMLTSIIIWIMMIMIFFLVAVFIVSCFMIIIRFNEHANITTGLFTGIYVSCVVFYLFKIVQNSVQCFVVISGAMNCHHS
jgi:hypothetical protein